MSAIDAADVKVLQPKDGSPVHSESLKISHFKDLASYNWLDEADPTVLVPGKLLLVVAHLSGNRYG